VPLRLGDFSRMLVGIPPGGLYESYLLFDNSMLTGTAQQWTEQEAKSEVGLALFTLFAVKTPNDDSSVWSM
jgi:hypothetical protein